MDERVWNSIWMESDVMRNAGMGRRLGWKGLAHEGWDEEGWDSWLGLGLDVGWMGLMRGLRMGMARMKG